MRFLIERQDRDGAWRDFNLKSGRSDAWVTAYVGDRLVRAGHACSGGAAASAVAAARRFLDAARTRAGGWAYNCRCPPDGDSTAQAISFLLASGESVRLSDYAALGKFQLPNGAFTTYRTSDPDHGWGRGHPEVTATALRVLAAVLPPDHDIVCRGLAYLADRVRGLHAFASYWWASHRYLEKEVLMLAPSLRGRLGDQPGLAETDATSFDQALAIEVGVLRREKPRRLRRLARHLVARQCADGGWNAAPIMRITDPRSRNIGDALFRASPVACDDRRLLTTATALSALHAVEHAVPGTLRTRRSPSAVEGSCGAC